MKNYIVLSFAIATLAASIGHADGMDLPIDGNQAAPTAPTAPTQTTVPPTATQATSAAPVVKRPSAPAKLASGFSLTVGEHVINGDGSARGVVKAISPNGQIRVLFDDGSIYTQSWKDLGRFQGTSNGFTVGDRVINYDGSAHGIIQAIYPNGQFSVIFEGGGTYVQEARRLGHLKGEVNGLKVGDQTVNSDSSACGIVQAVYPDGQISVVFENGSTYTQDPKQMGRFKGSAGGISVGQQVLNGDRSARGIVQAVFPNGQVSVLFENGATYTQDPRELQVIR